MSSAWVLMAGLSWPGLLGSCFPSWTCLSPAQPHGPLFRNWPLPSSPVALGQALCPLSTAVDVLPPPY